MGTVYMTTENGMGEKTMKDPTGWLCPSLHAQCGERAP